MQRKMPGKAGQPPPKRSRYQNLIFDADRFFAEKDYDTAFQIYQQALQEAPPGENHPYAQLCRCYRKQARKLLKREAWDELVQSLETMLKINGNRPNLKGLDFKVLAEAYLETGALNQAVEALNQALKLNPELEPELKRLNQRIQAESLSQNMRNLF
jgi:tetratricopeptide (TPR) repeat protein